MSTCLINSGIDKRLIVSPWIGVNGELLALQCEWLVILRHKTLCRKYPDKDPRVFHRRRCSHTQRNHDLRRRYGKRQFDGRDILHTSLRLQAHGEEEHMGL